MRTGAHRPPWEAHLGLALRAQVEALGGYDVTSIGAPA
jgi:hypothetical protein